MKVCATSLSHFTLRRTMDTLYVLSVIVCIGLIQSPVTAAGPGKSPPVVKVPAVQTVCQDHYAICRMAPNPSGITGVLHFKQSYVQHSTHCTVEHLSVHVSIQNVPNKNQQRKKHGLHVHEHSDLSNQCMGAGGHYNPYGAVHGGPQNNKLNRHVGDFGNVVQNKGNPGVIETHIVDYLATLTGQYSIVGRSIVFHAKQDDFGQGKNKESKRTGNAGSRLACCIIEASDPIPDTVFGR